MAYIESIREGVERRAGSETGKEKKEGGGSKGGDLTMKVRAKNIGNVPGIT